MALANYPGFFVTSPPTDANPYGVFWPTLVPSELVPHRVVMDDTVIDIAPVRCEGSFSLDVPSPPLPSPPGGEVVQVPLGLIVGARSGDKGGNANVGLWTRRPEAYAWLRQYLTTERFRQLVPEARSLEIERYELPNLLALNFVVRGLLGDGVAASTRMDPQAKSFGEYVRAKVAEIPKALLAE